MHVCVLVRRISDMLIHPQNCWISNHGVTKKKERSGLTLQRCSTSFYLFTSQLVLGINMSLPSSLFHFSKLKTARFCWSGLHCATRRGHPRGDSSYRYIYSIITSSKHRSGNMRGTDNRKRAPVFVCTSGVQCKRAFFGEGSYAETLVRLF